MATLFENKNFFWLYIYSLFYKVSVQNNNNIRIWAIQLIQTADSSFQPVELVQMSNENVT